MTTPLGDACGAEGETAGGAGRSSGGTTASRPHKKRSKPATAGKGRWTMEEHADFLVGLQRFGKDWQAISELVKTRTHVQTRTHHQKYEQQIKKGRPFPEEPYEKTDDSTSTASASTPRPSSSSSSSSSLSSSSGTVSVPPPTVSVATVVRGKRLTRPPATSRADSRGGGGSSGPRSTRARAAAAARAATAAAAASRAAASASTRSEDKGRGAGGGFECGDGSRGKRLKMERSESTELAASALGQQQQHVGVGVTSPMGGSPAPCLGSEMSMVKPLWSAVGGMDGAGGNGGGGGGGCGDVVGVGGLCSRQLSPTLSEGFLEGFLAESDALQASPPTPLPASCSSSSSLSSSSRSSSSSSSASPRLRNNGIGGVDKGSLNRNLGSQGLGSFGGGGSTTITSSPMHDGHRFFQQQRQQQYQRQRQRLFQQQQQFMSAAAAAAATATATATAAATASSRSPLYGGITVFGAGGGGQMDAFGASPTAGGVGAFGCPPTLSCGHEHAFVPAIDAAAHASGFGGPVDANSAAALSLEPSAITIPGVRLCGYNSGFASVSGSSSGSDGGGEVGGQFSGAALLPPGSENSVISYRSGCGGGGGGGVWRDTPELAGDVGGLRDGGGGGVGLPSPLGAMLSSGQQHRRQQSDCVESSAKQQQMDPRCPQSSDGPAVVDVRSAPPSRSCGADADADAASDVDDTTNAPADGSDSGNPYDRLVIDVDSGGDYGSGDGIPLADNWMGLDTIVGGSELEAWQNKAGDDDDDQFDFLAVFDFEDHFGML
eukprot:g15518.t1